VVGSDRREVVAVVAAVAVGGGVGVLATARAWSTVVVSRAAPLGPVRHDVSGRTLQPGVTGLAVVALAGVLAVLATRGVTRRVIGAVLALAGVGMVWWSVTGLSAVSAARGRQLVADARTVAGLGTASATTVTVHPAWVVLATLGGLFVAAGGVTTAVRGGRWRAMSARYESPVGATSVFPGPSPNAPDGRGGPGGSDGSDGSGATEDGPSEVARARADLALWHQLDRGEDPTVTEGGADEPTPTEPTPTEPAPAGPAPTEPAPSDPAAPGGDGDALGR
jgi:uncharacterized membrane protein (TIGR02234 family)